MIPVPLLTPYLSSLWLGLVTPIYARVGRKLVASLKNPTLVTDQSPAHRRYSVRPRCLKQAVARSLINEDQEFAETRWSDALSSGSFPKRWGGVRFGSRLVDSRTAEVVLPAQDTFAAVQRIGGDTGWYYGDWLWKFRGFLDLLAGGVGVRRGRRHPTEVAEGDALDFWRVEKVTPGRFLRLQAEMKLPGRACWSLKSRPITVPHASFAKRPFLIRWDCWGLPIGTRCIRFTNSSSTVCSRESSEALRSSTT